jgi:hypothetical protein
MLSFLMELPIIKHYAADESCETLFPILWIRNDFLGSVFGSGFYFLVCFGSGSGFGSYMIFLIFLTYILPLYSSCESVRMHVITRYTLLRDFLNKKIYIFKLNIFVEKLSNWMELTGFGMIFSRSVSGSGSCYL